MEEQNQQPQAVTIEAHQALVDELIQQRDEALASAANKGFENRMLKAQLQKMEQAQEAAAGNAKTEGPSIEVVPDDPQSAKAGKK